MAITADARDADRRRSPTTSSTSTVAAEQSVVQTRFPTTVLALLRASLGEDLGSGRRRRPPAAVTSTLPVAAGDVRQITFLGRGWAAAIAEEAALKCREAAGAWTESYPAMEYRHGPISVSGPGTVVWVFGDGAAGLAGDVAATGAQFVDDDLDPMVDLIRAQRLAVELARHAGRDPDRPRALSFSVVLDGTGAEVGAAVDRLAVVAVDVGGTSMKAGILGPAGLHVLRRVPSGRQRGPDAVLDNIATVAAALVDECAERRLDVVGVGVAVPGSSTTRGSDGCR